MDWNPHHMDVFEFFRQYQLKKTSPEFRLSGHLPLSSLTRLCAGAPEQTASVTWSVEPSVTKLNEKILTLTVSTQMTLVCQRCMKPMQQSLDSTVSLRVVDSEDELDAQVDFDHLDELAAEPYDDVLGSTSFTLISEIEDELILNLPYLPMHEACELNYENTPNEDKKPSPFRVLSTLKQKN